MLPNSAHLQVLLTLLPFQVIERKHNGWTSLKPAKMYSCCLRFLVKMSWIALLWREDSVNSSRKLTKLKHLVMELCVMVEGFCL